MPPTAAPSDDWLDDAFASYYAHNPVNATFVGVPGHDHRLPDFSEQGLGDARADVRALLASEAASPSTSPADPCAGLDRRLMRGHLEIQDWEAGSRHFARGNPSTYTGEAIFGLLGLFLNQAIPQRDRVEWAIARMEGVPAFLAQLMDNVDRAPAAWTRRALRECSGALAFLSGGIDQLASEQAVSDSGFRRSADRAARAFSRLSSYLEHDLSRRDSDGYGCGEEALARYLAKGHFLQETPDDVAAYAEDALDSADGRLRAEATRLGTEDPDVALARLADHHPTVDGYYARYQEVWARMKEVAQVRDLLTWPDFPIRYVPRPQWARSAAPDLYFLYYRSPSPFRRPEVHDYLVTPIESTMTPTEQASLLRANNDSVITLNHVIHHGGIGHHVQNWHAFRSRSRVGRVAAVDCASRIAMFCGGTMAEGWACYATDLMRATGVLTDLQALSELNSRRRMSARAVVDVRLHQGRMTLDQAADFYHRRAGMQAGAAEAEAVKNSMFPGAAVMYLMGTDAIHRLRRELTVLRGPAFSLRDFHDEFLSFGSIPVALIAEAMTRPDATDEKVHA